MSKLLGAAPVQHGKKQPRSSESMVDGNFKTTQVKPLGSGQALAGGVRHQLETGLELLGIAVPERM